MIHSPQTVFDASQEEEYLIHFPDEEHLIHSLGTIELIHSPGAVFDTLPKKSIRGNFLVITDVKFNTTLSVFSLGQMDFSLLFMFCIMIQFFSSMVLFSLRGSVEHNCKLLGCSSFSKKKRLDHDDD